MTVIGIAGFSGSGKTTLIEKLIPVLKEQGLRIAVIKHDGNDHIRDCEGTDTDRFVRAGADSVMLSSESKTLCIRRGEPAFQELLKAQAGYDLVLVEGYKYEAIPRIGIESVRTAHRLPEDRSVYEAIVTDEPARYALQGIVFDRNEIEKIARWIMDRLENEWTHFDTEGNARMVDVSDKAVTVRKACAGAKVLLNRKTFAMIKTGTVKKGDVLSVAQIAGIMGAKRTPDLIPMCHPLSLDGIDLRLSLNETDCSVDIVSEVRCTGRTGVEMEAVTAVSVAAMTVYDMCKAVQRDIVISQIRLLSKSGGVHGDYVVEENKGCQ